MYHDFPPLFYDSVYICKHMSDLAHHSRQGYIMYAYGKGDKLSVYTPARQN